MNVQPHVMAIAELESQLARYAAECRHRDLRLGAVLLACLALGLAVTAGVLALPWIPRRAAIAVLLAAGAVILGEGGYVAITTWGFHRTRVPRCPACHRSIASLEYQRIVFDLLRKLERRADITAEVREKLRDEATIRCPRCKAAIAAPAV